VNERWLEEVQGEHRDVLLFAVRSGEVLVLAIEELAVGAVPGLDDLEAFVNFAAQPGIGEVLADEIVRVALPSSSSAW
jgi:hypothetical protein